MIKFQDGEMHVCTDGAISANTVFIVAVWILDTISALQKKSLFQKPMHTRFRVRFVRCLN